MIQYLSMMTWPDIAYAILYLGRFNHDFYSAHWVAEKHLFWYLKGTSSYKLVYKGNDDSELFQTYSDVSHGGCKESGYSLGSYTTIVCSEVVE